MVLGANWDVGEWPEYVSIIHEADVTHGYFSQSRKYVPERTCKMEKPKGSMWPIATCSECGEKTVEGDKRYCPNCGAKCIGSSKYEQGASSDKVVK